MDDEDVKRRIIDPVLDNQCFVLRPDPCGRDVGPRGTAMVSTHQRTMSWTILDRSRWAPGTASETLTRSPFVSL